MQITEATSFGRPQRESGAVRALIAGASAGLLGGIGWYLIVRFTGYEVGWIAWGIGLGVGSAMAAATAVRSKALAAQAGLLAAAALIVGKVLIFQWAAGPALAKELQQNPEALRQLAFMQMYESGAFPTDVQAQVTALADDEPWPDSLTARIESLVDSHIQQMGGGELESAALQMAGMLRSEVSVVDGVFASLSLFDLLWFFLAIGTAWKLLLPREETTVAA
jgi:short subunit fatty acids transporter